MITSSSQLIWKDRKAIRPPAVFLLLAVALAVAVHFMAMAVFESSGMPVGLFALIGVVALHGLVDTYPHKTLGLCNGVTLTRAALASVLAGAVFAPEFNRWVVFAIASVAFAMDGLDGWLARRTGLTSGFGARFDMEVDAVLSALLAVILLTSGRAGPEVLVLGFLRYGFVGLSFLVPKLQAELPPSLRRKTVCVIQIAALLFLMCPLAPEALLMPVTLGAVLLLLWSFAVDTCWLMRVAQ
ncbi:MAG: CDP-alcohol phosphatidyltransferase family protein [Litoreibacter sp.]|nr:CDP-alcohol phosphatidyltransferase family protein [Litoreibacter sp.]